MAKSSIEDRLKRLTAEKERRDKKVALQKQIIDARKGLEALRKKK